MCKGLWNRDVNSSFNIFKIVEETIAGKGRPEYLQRKKQIVSNTTSVLHNQILDEDVKPQLWNFFGFNRPFKSFKGLKRRVLDESYQLNVKRSCLSGSAT